MSIKSLLAVLEENLSMSESLSSKKLKMTILNKFFDVFLYEELSALGASPREVYSDEAINSDIYIGLIGSDYGSILESGISPTELEYDLYNKTHNDALIYIKDVEISISPNKNITIIKINLKK